MKKSFLLILSFIIFTQNLYADDVIGKRFSIKRVKKPDDKIAFTLCDANYKPARCEYIGRNEGYTISDLDDISRSELIEARWKTGGAVVLGIVGAAVGLYAAAVLAPTAAAGSTATASFMAGETTFFLALGTTTAGAATPFYINKVNPIRQYKQSDILSRDGIYNSIVLNMSDDSVREISQLMEEVLN